MNTKVLSKFYVAYTAGHVGDLINTPTQATTNSFKISLSTFHNNNDKGCITTQQVKHVV